MSFPKDYHQIYFLKNYHELLFSQKNPKYSFNCWCKKNPKCPL